MNPPATLTDDAAMTALLAAADVAFYREGIAAVTMADIRAGSGVSLRRMYSLFPAKSDLVAAWLAHRHHTWMAWFEHSLESTAGGSPIEAIFDTLAAWLHETSFRGCGFLNTLAESVELTAEHQQIIRDHKQALINTLSAYCDDPEALAVLIDGAIVQAGVFENNQPVEAARRLAIQTLESSP